MSGKAIRKHELRKAAREHVDHEMARFLDLHVEINRGSHHGIVLGAILTVSRYTAGGALERLPRWGRSKTKALAKAQGVGQPLSPRRHPPEDQNGPGRSAGWGHNLPEHLRCLQTMGSGRKALAWSSRAFRAGAAIGVAVASRPRLNPLTAF